MPLKILVISNTAWSILNYRMDLLSALEQDGYDIVTASPPDNFADEVASRFPHFPLSNLDRKGKNPLRELIFLRELYLLIRKVQPDLLLTFTIKPNIYGAFAARLCRIPSIPNVTGLGSAFANYGMLRRIVTRMYMRTFSKVPAVMFQNDEDRSVLVNAGVVPDDRAHLIPGSGVNLDHFAATPLPGTGQRIRFLMVSRMLWDKGVQYFVDAARRISARFPDARFALLGPVDEQNPSAIPRKVLESWHKEQTVSYLGEVRDVRQHISESDVIVMPTYYREGTPRSLLEAMAMGRPIITTDVAGCRDTVDDGVNGFLVPPRDEAALAEAMERFVEMSAEERRGMGMASIEKARTQFDTSIVINTYRKVISNLFA